MSEIVETGERAVLDVAGFHLGGGRGAVGDDLPDDTVEIGGVRAPVVLVALGDDVLAALVLDELEGAGADRGEVGGVLADVAAAHRGASPRCSRDPAARAAAGRAASAARI